MKSNSRLMTMLALGGALGGALPGALASTLYRCADESGVVLYTNQKTAHKNCSVLSVQTPPAAAASRPRPSGAASTPSPNGFPRVSGDEQKARDGDRRAILERELANEQAALEKARQGAAGAGGAGRDTLALHERNIEALNKELGKLR